MNEFAENESWIHPVGSSRPDWNEVKALISETATRTVPYTTLPTDPFERQIIYQAPFTKCDRETDYATVRGKLEERQSV